MHSLLTFVLIACYVQVGFSAMHNNVFTEKRGRQVVETAQERDFTCPGVDGAYASPQQCVATYYQCLEGIAYPQTCPAGNVFDPVTYICTPSAQASCNQKFDCSIDGLFPYPGACTNLYYVCSAGESYVQYCPVNYAFDPVTLRCVAVEDATCTAATSTSTTSTTPSTVTTRPSPTTTSPLTTTRTSIIPETAPTTKGTSTIPNTTSSPTSTSVQTINPLTSPTTTPSIPSTTQWTTSTTIPTPTRMSTTEETAKTTRPTTPATTQTTTPVTTSTVIQTTTKVSPTTTQSPISTATPTAILTSTPTTPLTTPEVTTAAPSTANTAPPMEFACSRTGHYLYPGNCGLYYVCGGGVYIIAACPDGQVFNPSNEYCENPINVRGCEAWAV